MISLLLDLALFCLRLFYSTKLLLSVLSVITGNITNSLPDIVYECVARVSTAIGNEQLMFP